MMTAGKEHQQGIVCEGESELSSVLPLASVISPGHYSPEKAGRWIFASAPIYSLASRSKEFENDKTPGESFGKLVSSPLVTKALFPAWSVNGMFLCVWGGGEIN